MPWLIRGLIEGFYGTPWSWTDRAAVMRSAAEWGMTHYVYAPKDDPLHRERWREPYPAAQLAEFERLAGDGSMEVGFAIAPGLSIDYEAIDDLRALATKVDVMIELGVSLIVLALDDIPPRPGLGPAHAELTRRVHDHLAGRANLVLVPTEYTGRSPTTYLDALADGVPASVPIAWTGPTVVCDAITADDARARAAALDGRAPLVWDNFPVNDAVMSDRLFTGPLRGRDPSLVDACCGYLANPMTQPRASLLPLDSVAAFLRGEDPEQAWAAHADAEGLRVFAEACDGARPNELVAAVSGATSPSSGALDELEAWIESASTCAAPGLEGEVDAWIDQVHREAEIGRCAVRLLRALAAQDEEGATNQALAIAYLWPDVRRSATTVMGPRCSFRPVLGQRPDGHWRFEEGSLQQDSNAIDHLVRHALARLPGSA